MQLTKGAIGNLINRYKAVLKKCHLMNTFGSLAVAGMLVMGGAGVAVAAEDVALGAGGSYDKTNEVNHLMGGGLYKDNQLTADTPVATDITLTVEGGSISEIIGGSYISGTNADYKNATHGTITTTISGKTTSAEFVVGGSKLANNDGATLETGTTAVTINGGTFGTAGETDAYELVMGGNYIKTGTGANGTATTDGSSVTVNGGTFHASVVGGSVAHNYSENGSITVTDNGNTSVTITGGTFNSSQSSLTGEQGGINLSAAVIGGGLAYGANTNSVLGSKEAPVTSSVTINDGTFGSGANGHYAKIVAGSVVANDGGTATVHGNTTLAMAGGTAHDDLIGGGMVENAATLPEKSTPSYNLNITGDSSVKVTAGGTALGEVIGGNYVKTSKASLENSAKVANSSVTITGGTFANVGDSASKAQYIIGGSKTNASGTGNATTLVEGNSSVLIDGDVTIEDGALIGGSQAKAGNGQSEATAIVRGNSSVTVNNGNLAGVIGGGIAETYYTTAIAKSTVDGTSFVTINGGNVTGNSIETGAVQNNTGKLSAAVVGGGLANDEGSAATVGSTRVTIANGTINGKVVAGGAAVNGGSSTVTHDTSLTMTGGKVDGDLIGGGFVDSSVDSSAGTANNKANVDGSTHITVSGGSLVDAEIIGGGSVRNANGTANVTGDTHVTVTKYANELNDQKWVQYVLGGGKAMTNGTQTATANVAGNTNVIIGEQGAIGEALDIKFGTVAGGGLARAQGGEGSATATVTNANVTVHSGILSGVAGGGIAESYNTGTATATVTNANLTIDGNATVNGIIYKGNDGEDTSSSAAVIGGGLAYSKNGSKATASVETANTTINGGTINGGVYAGGMADGANATANADGTSATANVGTANLTINGGIINGDVYAGGYALDNGTANVANANVTLKGGSINGKVTVGNATKATITLDGTGAKVKGDDTGDFEGNESSTLAFNNYNGKFENVAIGFGTLAVAENSNVYVDALVSGQRGSDRPNTGIFGAPTPTDDGTLNPTGSGFTITGGGTITAKEFHVNPDASVMIEHGNVVADDVKVQSATLTVGGQSTSASLTVNKELITEDKNTTPTKITVDNLGTVTLGKAIVLDDTGELLSKDALDKIQTQVNTGGTLKVNGLDGKKLTEEQLITLKGLTTTETGTGDGLLDLGGADLGEAVTPGSDGTVSYDKVAGITTDSLKDTTVAVTDAQNEDGISGGFQAVKLTENDKELNAKNTLGLAGSQNGGALVMDKDGNVADLRVGGALGSQDTSVVTLGLADANNTGAVNTVTMNAGTGNDATLNVIGAGAAEFTIGDIRANSSTNTINVQGATLNTGNITTEAVSPATLDAMNITNGTVKAAGDAEIKNVTLDNGLLQAVATTGETPAGGNITIAKALSGQGAVVADKTLTLTEDYDGAEGDDLTLQADTLSTGAIDSTTGDLTIAATNLVTSGDTSLTGDTLVADNVALGGALTASGASLVQVGGFYTSDDFTTEGLNKAVSVTGQSLMAYGADLAQAQQAVAETGHTGAAYYAGKELKLVDGGGLTVGDTADGADAVAFGSGSLLVVDGTAMNGKTVFTGEEASPKLTASVNDSSKLHVDNAIAGNFTVFDSDFDTTSVNGWADENVTTDSAMLDASYDPTNSNVTVKTNNAHTVFPNLSDGMADAVNDLYNGKLNNVDSTDMGVRFLSRATNDHFLGADKDAAAATIESAARIAFAGAVPQMTKMASDAGTNAVVNRLGFANPADGAQAMDAEGKIVDRNTTGFALWIAPLWQSQHGWGMEADNLDYGFNGNLGGVSLGADYTFENAIRAGITFNIGGGYAESSGGDLNSTENRMSFWGLGAYAGWNYENFGLMADVSYTSTWNDLKQDMDSRMGMGDLEADVQASAISAGLRAEYKLETSVLDVIPHIGVRYMSLNTWGFDAESNGGTVLEGDGFHQDIWTFPVGVTFTKDFTLDSGWSFKPSVDFSVIPAAGDIKAKQDVAFTGLPGSYEVETQMMDYLTWQGGVGLEMGNDTMSFGVNYTLQAGQHTTGHGVFGSFRYEF